MLFRDLVFVDEFASEACSEKGQEEGILGFGCAILSICNLQMD